MPSTKQESVSWLPAGSWVLYDLANTVYAATITFLLTPYFTSLYDDRTTLGVTQTVSMVLAGLTVPLWGSLCDRSGRAPRYLIISTLICVAAIVGFSISGGKYLLLLFFFAANIAYQTALVFYNALLPSVSGIRKAGFISGLGVGVGYLGTILTVAVLLPLSAPLGTRTTFALCAGAFLLLSLPCMFWVKERRVESVESASWRLFLESFYSLGHTLKSLRSNRPMLLFLVGNFFLVDVLNTAILFFADYTRASFESLYARGELNLFGVSFDPAGDEKLEMKNFLAVVGVLLNTLALVFGILFGLLSDRWHPLGTLRLSGWCLFVALVGGAVFGGSSPLGFSMTLVFFGAMGLAGIWTAGRKVLMLMAPEEKLGEYFGLYGITVKLSVLGSTTFGITADLFGMKAALLVQLVQLFLGLGLLHAIRRE